MIFGLLLALGLVPLIVGVALLRPAPRALRLDASALATSTMLCALSFNLTFLWQELWLVIPKTFVPGLTPVLYHNNHDWSGDAALAELLQGTGAVATLALGLAFLGLTVRPVSGAWRWFCYWMAVQGIFQAWTQLAIGSLAPGSDVGRALSYLHASQGVRIALLLSALAGMAVFGILLFRASPISAADAAPRTRAFAYAMAWPAIVSIALIIPFRLPRDLVEVTFVPLVINLAALGWIVLGAAIDRSGRLRASEPPPGMIGPAAALVLTLALFQLVLRPGVHF